jgi:TonB family protein
LSHQVPALSARLTVLVWIIAAPALAFEEVVRRQEVDAGVHVPVLTKAPVLLEFVPAQYPAEAQQQSLTAVVKMIVTVAADGTVPEVTVVEAQGHGFDESAVDAVKRFRFSPAEVDDAPAPVQIEYAYHFVLEAQADAGVPMDGGVGGLATAPPAPAQLQGVIIARGSRSRVTGAYVACDNRPGPEAYSDEDGHFELTIPSGECAVRVAAADFNLFQTTEVLEAGELKEVNFYLVPKVAGYQTVVRAERDKKEVVRRTLSREELQKIPGTFGDPVRVIQNFPGVARAPFLLGQLIVRGANPNQTLTFFDGVEIPLLFHVGGGPSVVNGEFLDRVDFFPGGFGARYGRAVGGVVDVASRKGASDTWHGVAKIDLLDTSLFFEAPLAPGVSVAAAARRSYIDALLPLVLPQDPQGGSLLVLPAYWDYQLRLDVGGKKGERLSDGSVFSVFAFGSDDQLKVIATGGGRNRDFSVDYHTLFHRLLATWQYKKGDTTFRLTPYGGYDRVSVDFGIAKLTAGQWTGGLRADLGVDVNRFLTVRAGADISDQVIHGQAEIPAIEGTQYIAYPGADPKTTTQSLAQDVNTFDGALYVEADGKLGPVTVTPGLRASHAYIAGQVRDAWDPRLWVRFEPFSGTVIKGSAGLYTQPPPGTSLVPPPFGSPQLTHERAFQSSLGVAQRITDLINIDVTGFFNRRYENIVSPGTTLVNADGSITRTRESNNGLGRAYGLEVMLRHEVSKHFFGWVAYTLSRSEERRAGTTEDYRLASFDQTHILTVVGSVRLPWGFELGARFRYVTGRPKTPLAHDADFFQADSYSYSSTFGEYRSDRVRDFHQLDVRLDKNFYFQSWTLDVYLDVQNVYNATNVEGSFYDYRFRQEFDVPGVPILPVIGVKASF